ncbi:PRP38 family-domain-containing protein [Dunaliella salina]|uniref:Pre-mRNA-splicing factor 38 n=1 Tax=Dunaliella salina TaxID=3046 RepID=A0ABQ7H406_DUNSA|nr:PRP38 family-domain-containing protein [Dunaliella salina]|eukprot:KAF5841593.1 PRP38 family-domain-containing protein [Dunaliella salina]
MANRTDKEAYTIHGTNPQNLVEYIVRNKIYQTVYWKESCFALTAETLIDKAVDLKAAGGTYGGQDKPTNFMCLILKMLQIQPDKEIIIEYIRNEDFKYVRLLGAFYMRLVGRPLEVYQYLEPLYNDYRKIRVMTKEGKYMVSHVDELVDAMLNKDHLFDIALPRIPTRYALEKTGQLDKRVSVLDEEFDEAMLEQETGTAAERAAQARRHC